MTMGKIFIATMLIAIVSGTRAMAEAPPMEPGQKVEVREGDTWSPATLEKKEGRKFFIRYADNTEEWITADRIRAVGAQSSSTGSTGATGSTNSTGSVSSITVDGPFTQINLQQPSSLPRHDNVSVLIPKPATRPAAPFTDLTPSAGASLGNLDQLIMCPDTPDVVVAVGGAQGDETPLLLIDVAKHTAESRVFTVHDHKVIGAADGGRVLLTQPNKWGSVSLHLWEYRDGNYQLAGNYTFISNKANKHPDWARLLSPTRLLLRSGFGETYLIDLPTKQQVGYIQCGDLAIHCSGQFLLSSKDQASILLRPSNLAIIAQVPHSQNNFSVDPTGTFAATGDGRSISVVKLPGNQPVAQIGGLAINGQVDLLGATDVLVNGDTFYDLKTGIPVWKYNSPNAKSMMLDNGQMLYVTSVAGLTTIGMAAIPDAAAAGAVGAATADKFIISPGAHIAIAGDLNSTGDAAVARTNIEHALAAAGQVSDNAATQFKLTLSSAAGPTEKFNYREFQRMGPPGQHSVDAPCTIVTAVLTKDGATIWQRDIKFSAGFMLNRKADESVEQAVAEAAKPDPARLSFLDIPGYIVKGAAPGQVVTLGESTLNRAGFAAAPAPK